MTPEFLNDLPKRFRSYQITAIASLLFAVIGFSFNAWRMAESEQNNTIRTASFEILIQLSALEQVVFAAYYDKDLKTGSPRLGWIAVGLIDDLSQLTDKQVQASATELKQQWQQQWPKIHEDQSAVEAVQKSTDAVRKQIHMTLRALN